MTIQSQTTRVDYTGNGATTNFSVPFYWLQDTDLLVIRTDSSFTPPTVATLALGTDYVVTGSGNQSGGSITTTAAPTATQKLAILRNVPFTQLTHYVPNDPFPAASHEQALDKLTMEMQQLNEGLSRSITLPRNATGLSTNLPLPAANNLIGWNQAANALQNVDLTTIATSVTYGNAKGDLFSGNGATVNFNLSANPGGINNLDVSISGVTQRPGIDYTWTAGTTLTFTTAPASGTNNILVRYTQALPIGTAAAGNVAFDNTTLDQQFLRKVNRVVDSIAALRGLSKTTYTRAFVTGYYAAGDGANGNVYYDPTDTTSGAYFTGSIAPITAPAAPALGSAAGGTLAATTYYVKVTYVTAAGETLPSAESSLAVAVNNVLTVTSPSAQAGATGYNVYVGTASGNETLQNSTPIAIGTNWTEPTTGLIAGVAMPTASTAGSLLTVSAITNGALAVPQIISGSGITPSYLIAQVSGTGGTGTYVVDNSTLTVASQTMEADDGGSYFVAYDGARWKRIFATPPYLGDFGAVPDNGLTDNYGPLQNWLNYITGLKQPSTKTGFKGCIRSGRYGFKRPVKATFRKDNSIIDDGDFRRLTIEGDGQANTYLIYTGPTTGYAFDIEGYVNGANTGGAQLYIRMSGFRFWRDLGTPRVGGGLQFNNVAYVELDDMSIGSFNINVNAQDTLLFVATATQILGGNGGLLAAKNTFSNPNVFKLIRCGITGNLAYGVQATAPANWSFDTCNFEGNGNDQVNSNTINIIGGPAESGSGINVFNSYFEGNQVAADINIGFNSANSGTVSIKNNGFNRVDATKYAKTHINLSCTSTGVMVANVGGNGFKAFNNYVPSSSNPVMILQTAGITLSEAEPNYYQNSVELPNYNGFPSIGAGADKDLMMALVAAGVSPSITQGWNAASVTHQATGVHRVNYKTAPANGVVIPTVSLVGGVGYAYISGNTTAYVEVSTFNTAGTATDINFALHVKGLG